MKASVMDLRYRTKEVLRALDLKEEIILTHRGNPKGLIIPIDKKDKKHTDLAGHQAIGMWADYAETVPDMITRLRKPRICL